MKRCMRTFGRDERGAVATEYALLIAAVVVGIVVIIARFGAWLEQTWTDFLGLF